MIPQIKCKESKQTSALEHGMSPKLHMWIYVLTKTVFIDVVVTLIVATCYSLVCLFGSNLMYHRGK